MVVKKWVSKSGAIFEEIFVPETLSNEGKLCCKLITPGKIGLQYNIKTYIGKIYWVKPEHLVPWEEPNADKGVKSGSVLPEKSVGA
jgi:hypothetical protein